MDFPAPRDPFRGHSASWGEGGRLPSCEEGGGSGQGRPSRPRGLLGRWRQGPPAATSPPRAPRPRSARAASVSPSGRRRPHVVSPPGSQGPGGAEPAGADDWRRGAGRGARGAGAGGQRGEREGRPREGAGGEVACGERLAEPAAPAPPGPREPPRCWLRAETRGSKGGRRAKQAAQMQMHPK